jgi:hypothetical protein
MDIWFILKPPMRGPPTITPEDINGDGIGIGVSVLWGIINNMTGIQPP